MSMELVETPEPLEPRSLPSTFVDRSQEQQRLKETASRITEAGSRNLHIHGTRGQGKTHLTQAVLEQMPDRVNTCYVPCKQCDTQYKALKQVYAAVTHEQISNGYHTSDLLREIEEHVQAVPAVIVLDDIEFALLNDGDSLLYTLSRLEHGDNISIITTSSHHRELPVEERTWSSLQPEILGFPEYTGEEVYRILATRAQDSLKPQSLHREALTYIASTTSNIRLGLLWLLAAAEETDSKITESAVRTVREQALQEYTDHLLQPFSEHHRLIHQAIQELDKEQDPDVIQTGAIYTRYNDLCESYSVESLSNRRISDYLKHLELLDLIEADYHYGGKEGKTRRITLSDL